MRQKQGMEPCQKKITSSKRKTKLHSTRPRKNGVLLAASTKEPEEREFAVDSGASMHMVSKTDLSTAELETMRSSRSPTDDGQRRGANKKRSHGICQRNGLVRDGHAS